MEEEPTPPEKIKKFKCTVCDKSFTSKHGLAGHTLSHTGEKPWVCEHCSQSFRDQSNLISHRKTHAPDFEGFKCEFCGKSFDYKKRLNEHIRTVHMKISTPSIEKKKQLKAEKRKFLGLDKKEFGAGVVCQDCGKWFLKSAKLKIHINTVHMNKSAINPMDHAIALPGSGFMCKNCSNEFKNKKGVISHVRIVHFDLLMDICDKDIGSVFSDKTSESNTTNPIPDTSNSIVNLLSSLDGLKCNLCEKSFKHKKDLKDHIIIKHEMRNDYQVEPPPTALSMLQIKLQSQLIQEYRGEEVPVALDFVRGMDEEGLKLLLEQGEVFGLKKALEGFGLFCGKKETEDFVKEEDAEKKDLVKEEGLVKEVKVKQELEYEEVEMETEDYSELDTVESPGSDEVADCKHEKNNKESIPDKDCDTKPMCDEIDPYTEPEEKLVNADGEKLKMESVKNQITAEEKKKTAPICPTCGKSFKKMSKLKRHMITHMNVNTPKELVEMVDSQLFKCRECRKEFRASNAAYEHIRLYHMNLYEKVDPSKVYVPRRLKLPANLHPKGTSSNLCQECGQSFSSKHKMERHIKTIHQDIKDFPCDYCTKEFTSSHGLKGHIETIHMGIKLKCPDCENEYSTPKALKNHIEATHSKDICYICNQCGKSFPTAGRLDNHKYEHEEGEMKVWLNANRKFPCQDCGKEYASLPGLRVHIDVVHKGLKNHICHLCGQSFGRRSCLAAHKQTHHGLGPTKQNTGKKKTMKKISDGSEFDAGQLSLN